MMMSIPHVYLAKAMNIRFIILSLAVAYIAILLFTSNQNTYKPSNTEAQDLILIPLPGGVVGPESFAFDGSGGGPYSGVSDGRILRWLANESWWVDFSVTSQERDGCEGDNTEKEHICGRPLGLRFNKKTGQLYIADAYMGLVVVGPNGGLATPVSKQVNGVPFGFTNSLDIDHTTGLVYFTDSSTLHPRRDYISAIITSDATGRLMQYNSHTNQTTLLLDNLKFPNGVALSENGNFLLFVETTTCTLYKFWLKTPKAGNLETLAEFSGFPDNIKRNRKGEFWVGINSKKSKFTNWIISNSLIGNFLDKIVPVDITKVYLKFAGLIGNNMGMGIRLSEDGNIVEILDYEKGKKWDFVSEVEEHEGYLWIGSVSRSFVIRQKFSK